MKILNKFQLIQKINKSPFLISYVCVPCLLFAMFIYYYSSLLKSAPVTYWDEMLWVGRSYFFQLYIHGDFHNENWQSYESFDQPKLAEYAYGAWIYPLYLSSKVRTENPSDYIRFLIQNNFYEINEQHIGQYASPEEIQQFIKFNEKDSGFIEDYREKYGNNSIKTIEIIYYARRLSVLFLAGATLTAYYIALPHTSVLLATGFASAYGFNTLLIDTGLKAHSEALFLFTFNTSLLFMIRFFANKSKTMYLILFSIFAGMCASTKLNGFMTLPIFIFIAVAMFYNSKVSIKSLILSMMPVLLSILIFISLNPFVYSSPYTNTHYMLNWRMKEASACLLDINSFICLPSPVTRIRRIFTNFYLSEKAENFNGLKILEGTSWSSFGTYVALPLFLLGLFSVIIQAIKKHIFSIMVICSFVVALGSMSYYLMVDWSRYYVQLVLFFVGFQCAGFYVVAAHIYKYITCIFKKAKIIKL